MTVQQDQTSHGHTAYLRLLDEIRSGTLLPGMRLRELELCDRLQISRTPVREALRRLEADGLVIHQPRLGAVVRRLGYPEIMELYEMRAVLESTAARLAARAASDAELAELKALNEEFGQVLDDEAAAAEVNRQFHATLLDAAKNRFLRGSVGALQKTMLILGRSTLMDSTRAHAAVQEHGRILDAMVARDGSAAEAEMRAHIEAAQVVRIKALRALDRGEEDVLWTGGEGL